MCRSPHLSNQSRFRCLLPTHTYFNFLEQKLFRGTDCLGAVIRRKLTSATNGRADNTNQQMPNYLKPDTEQTFEEGTPSSNEGQGCQTPDRNTYQLASHAEWNLPKTGFIISSSWPITIDRRADSRAHSWASSLPHSQSTWATTFVMRACAVCLPGTNSCSWGIRLIVCYSLPQGR